MAQSPSPSLAPVPPGAAPAGGKKKILLMAVIAIAVLAVAGVAFVLFMKEPAPPAGGGAESGQEAGKEGGAKHGGTAEPEGGAVEGVLAIKPVVVNLADSGVFRVARIGINLGCNDKKLTETFANDTLLQSQVQDVIIQTISARTSDELLSPKGKDNLKKELLDALNKKLEKSPIEEIYFTEFLVQL